MKLKYVKLNVIYLCIGYQINKLAQVVPSDATVKHQFSMSSNEP